MTSRFLRCAALAVALVAPVEAYPADDGIGAITGTATPEVIIPPTTAAPQTPAYPPPPIGATAPGFFGPPAPGITRMGAPRPVAPVKPHG